MPKKPPTKPISGRNKVLTASTLKPVEAPSGVLPTSRASGTSKLEKVVPGPVQAVESEVDDLRRRIEGSVARAVQNAPPADLPVAESGLPPTLVLSGQLRPTEEQQLIIDTALKSPPVLVVIAAAGSGKTASLRMLADALPGMGQYTAFNTKLVDDSKAKFHGTNVQCNTTHSLAFRAIGKQYAHRLNGRRVRSWEIAKMLDIQNLKLSSDKTLSAIYLATQLVKALGRFSQSADKEIDERHFPYIDGIDMPEGGKRTYDANNYVRQHLLPFAQDAWADIQDRNGLLPFQHDFYVKLWQLSANPVIAADYILIDECFPAGTRVSTDQGDVPIEQIVNASKDLWFVLSRDSMGRIRRSRVTAAYATPHLLPLVRIKHAFGQITTTANHPFWIDGRGWVAAGLIRSGDSLSYLQQAVPKKDKKSQGLLKVMRAKVGLSKTVAGNKKAIQRENESSSRAKENWQTGLVATGFSLSNLRQANKEGAKDMLDGLRVQATDVKYVAGERTATAGQDFYTNETSSQGNTEPYGTPRSTEKSFGHFEADWTRTSDTRREWNGADKTAVTTLSSSRQIAARLALDPRTCRLKWSQKAGSSDLLQNRHCVDQATFSNRSGRELPQTSGQKGSRREERSSVIVSRVESVEVIERGNFSESDSSSSQGNTVFTISVEDGNYFADGILVKNCQDSTPVLLDVLCRQNTQLILVGDDGQRIYEWRGSVSAGSYFPDAPRCYLSQSFRFGDAIADVANRTLGRLAEPTQLRLKGLPSIPSVVGKIDSPTAVLTRTNAEAVGTLLEAIVKGKRAFLVGGGSDVSSFVRAAQELQDSKATSHPELACFNSWLEVREYAKSEEGEDLQLLVKLIDSFGAKTIISALESMPSEKNADLVVSTCHKCVAPETLVETSDWGIVQSTNLEGLTGGKIGTPTGQQRFAEFFEYRDSPMLKITTSDGYEIAVTENHGMMAWAGDRYERVDAAQLSEGQFLRLALFSGVPDPIDSPRLPNGEEIETDVRAIRYSLPKELDESNSFLLGALAADGTLWQSGVRYTKSYKSAVDAVVLAFTRIGVSPKVWQRSSPENDWVVEVNSTHLAGWLRRIGGLEPHAKDIPSCVLQGSRSHQAAFLRGLFGDGTVGVRDGKLDVVSITSAYLELAEKVQFLLRRLGIVSRRFPIKSKLKDKTYNHWRVEMYSTWARKFLVDVGFPDTDRTQKGLAAIVPERNNGYLVPVNREEAGKALSYLTTQNARSQGYVSRRILERDLPLLSERLAYHHDKIVSIEKYRGASVCVSVSGGRFLQNGFDGFNSKGRQWERVILAGDFPVMAWNGQPTYKADGEEIDEPKQVADSDIRLAYVAATRAQLALDITECPFFTGRKKFSDYKGAAEHIKNNPPAKNPRRGTSQQQGDESTTPSLQSNSNGDTFSWSKCDDNWVVRGPSGKEGQSVEVSRKDGSTSRRQLGKVIKEVAEGISLYQ